MNNAVLSQRMQTQLRRRHAAEKRFRWYGAAALCFALAFLFVLLATIIFNGAGVFIHKRMLFEVAVSEHHGDRYGAMIKDSWKAQFPEVTNRRQRRELYGLISRDAEFLLREHLAGASVPDNGIVVLSVPFSGDAGEFLETDPEKRDAFSERLSPEQRGWLERIEASGQVETVFNKDFFLNADSREPEIAGILGALIGSMLTMCVTFLFSFPIGVMAAIYLEEFAAKGRLFRFIEVNINNLAAVPSIVFGLLGLAVFIGLFGVPRSTPLVGGLVLGLMTLPTMIIATRAALQAVPSSLRYAALALGATPTQALLHQGLPAAMPGIFTGAIIGMAQALGETAPLLMIGMVAFVADIPDGFTSASTALPVQVFLWADSPERGFVEKTSAAILVLLAFLAVMNSAAIYLRRKFEIKW
ncbi:MAG: phosphate ABC transporter permease PstA [Hyphomicrobiales bacterium]|nr:phosphate ABC transporter permease PstA [Hyphomicrobiales bacterium]MCY4038003.1 phosphate ABC transporter permease PstA [Hyphomicrobiales bacterium]